MLHDSRTGTCRPSCNLEKFINNTVYLIPKRNISGKSINEQGSLSICMFVVVINFFEIPKCNSMN